MSMSAAIAGGGLAGMVIARRLNKIASTSSVSTSRADRRKQILVDLAFGMTSPIVLLIFSEFRWLLHIELYSIILHSVVPSGSPFRHFRGYRTSTCYPQHIHC